MILPVIYQDEHLVAINKPPGLICHPAGEYQGDTVIARLKYCWGDRVHLVHRLDQNTSGAMVAALTDTAVLSLYRQFEKHRAVKKYLALVSGKVASPEGDITFPLSAAPPTAAIKLKIAVNPEGRVSHTHYRTLYAGEEISLLEVTLHTGRKHQIRVHLAQIGHPIVGDSIYQRSGLPFLWQYYCRRPSPWCSPLKGHGLHSRSLEITHPVQKRRLCFTASLPEDWGNYLSRLCIPLARIIHD